MHCTWLWLELDQPFDVYATTGELYFKSLLDVSQFLRPKDCFDRTCNCSVHLVYRG